MLRKQAVAALVMATLLAQSTFTDAFTTLNTPSRSCFRETSDPTSVTVSLSSSSVKEDCGCQETLFSGKPSEVAKNLNAREAIRKQKIFSVSGEDLRIDDLIGTPADGKTSIVVFLRSLG